MKKINLLRFFNLHRMQRYTIPIGFALFIIANILISSISWRLDLSKGKAYTLSSSTEKIIKSLDKELTINFFVSSDLPTRLLPLKNDVTDLLQEYKKEGRKINLKMVNPKKDKDAADQAKDQGIPELQFSQVERDKYALTSVYFGIAIIYDGKKEIIPQVTEFGNLEYNLTAAIYKLTRKDIPRIGIIGYEQISDMPQDPLRSLKSVLSQQFTVENLNLSSLSNDSIDSSNKTLLVFDNNNKQYSEKEIEMIKNYLEKGGKAIFFVDGVWVQDNLLTIDAEHNLSNFLNEWGVDINKDLVLSTSSEFVNLGNGRVSYFAPYPFWIKTNNFNNNSSYFSSINQIMYPWGSSLKLSKKDGIESQWLVKTTLKSWRQMSDFTLNPQLISQPQSKDIKEFEIAVEVKNKSNGHIIVIPSSRFVLDSYLSRTSDNLEFVLNAVNNLASWGALSGIRQRAVLFYPLPDLPDDKKNLFKYANMIFLPGLFGLYGIIRLMKRN